MSTPGPAADSMVRRVIAVELLRDGKLLTEVADLLSVSVSSIKRWKKAFQQGGLAALAPKRHPGPKSKLSVPQKRRLRQRFCCKVRWLRVSTLICGPSTRCRGGPARVRHCLPSGSPRSHPARSGLQSQKAATPGPRTGRSSHRVPARGGLAADQKGGRRRQATIVLLDETGFLLQPLNRRTWAGRCPAAAICLGPP